MDINYSKKPNKRCLKDFMIKPNMDCIVLVNRGGLILRSCLLSLK